MCTKPSANAADASASLVRAARPCPQIVGSGYNHKLPTLISTLVDKLATFKVRVCLFFDCVQ